MEQMITRAFRSAYPELDLTLRQLLRAGQTREQIWAHINPLLPLHGDGSLVRTTLTIALDYYVAHGSDAEVG